VTPILLIRGSGEHREHAVPEFDPTEYGSNVAGDYDIIYGAAFDTQATVDRLTELAGDGPILELGVGTGRLAIPLAQQGFTVHGVDGSEQMLQLLQAKAGSENVGTTRGDFSEVRLEPAQFSLVVLAVNTIFALEDQAAQVRCFATAAHHLRSGGRFVVEAWVPENLPAGQSLRPRKLSPGFIGIVVADNDPSTQTLATTQIVLGGSLGVRVFPVVHRYAWPSELDLMASLAGLTLESRWADWKCTSFGPASTNHVSVYRLGA
jgi:SAM-dependent methyltransferase